jgi:hypothetical protein
MLNLRFTQADAERAHDEWGCNCGPAALAAALGLTLREAGHYIPDFEKKGYTSPTMMADALRALGVRWQDRRGNEFSPMPDCFPVAGLVRIQWGGPWTAEGANARWAYGHTHWIATTRTAPDRCYVFDVNGGLRTYGDWHNTIVPLLLPKRGNGRFWPTHLWDTGPLGGKTS